MDKAEIKIELEAAHDILLLMTGQRNLSREEIDNAVYYICRNLERMIAEID